MAARPGLREAESGDLHPGPGSVEYVSLPLSVIAGGQRRLDGEAYLTGGFAARQRIEAALQFQRLFELAEVWQPGRLKGIQVGPEHGVPFLAATQAFDIRPTPRKWIAARRTPDLDARFVGSGWILVTCSGNVGDSIVSYAALNGAIVSHDLLRLQAREPRLRGYIYAFLRTRLGRSLLRSYHYGSIVKHLEPEHLTDVPVPAASDQLCREIEEKVAGVITLRDAALKLMNQAERRFQEEFGPFNLPDEWSFSTNASAIFGGRRRLDGYYHNPAAASAHLQMMRRAAGVVPLSSVTHDIFGVPRFKHVYTERGTPYLDSEDLFKINPRIEKFIPEPTHPKASAYYVKQGWLLMASSGQIYGLNGSAVLADSWHEKKIISNHVVRIVPRGIRPGYLLMAMSHPGLGQPQILRMAFGSQVPEIAPEDLRTFPVARLSRGAENAIADRVERACQLRAEARAEEDSAVQLVEDELARLLN